MLLLVSRLLGCTAYYPHHFGFRVSNDVNKDLLVCVCLCATGTKIFVTTESGTPGMENMLRMIYELYTDYVLKNPFYEVEMPIRCELWDLNLAQLVRKDGKAGLTGRWTKLGQENLEGFGDWKVLDLTYVPSVFSSTCLHSTNQLVPNNLSSCLVRFLTLEHQHATLIMQYWHQSSGVHRPITMQLDLKGKSGCLWQQHIINIGSKKMFTTQVPPSRTVLWCGRWHGFYTALLSMSNNLRITCIEKILCVWCTLHE